MGLKMNGLSGTSAAAAVMNGNVSNMNQINGHGHKMKSDKKQQQQQQQQQQNALGQNFMNQSLAAVENFMKHHGGVLPNSNSFLPMNLPNLQNLPKYEKYDYNVMNAALLASFSNPFYPMNINPYHIQNLLKLTTAAQSNLNSPSLHDDMNDVSRDGDDNDEPKSPHTNIDNNDDEHSNPEDLIEEVNETDESKLIMDINDEENAHHHDEKINLVARKENNNNHSTKSNTNESDDEETNRNDNYDDDDDPMTPKTDSHEKLVVEVKQESNFDDESHSRNDSLRCRHCDKVFNHPAEHLQHETILCTSLMMKRQEGLMMHMVESMNNNNNINNNNLDDDMDDRESKISTESERKVRVRTAISEEQQAVLKEFYAFNPRPNREDFRNIAQRLMLDARVVQVWFQNNRSRERKQNGVSSGFKHENGMASSSSDEQPLDLSIKKEMSADSPTTSPRYGTVPLQHNNNNNDSAVNLSRKMAPFSPLFQPHFNSDFLSSQIPSPNEAVSQFTNARNGMPAYNLPLGLPLERLLQFTPEMARNPLLMMKSDPRSPANSLSPGNSEKRSWKDDESRSFDEQQQQQQQHHHHHQPYQPQRRMPKMKSEIPPDSSEFQFVCDLCDKAFRKQSSLARHKYEHSGE
jgi:zinc finger homeobox protein 1/2